MKQHYTDKEIGTLMQRATELQEEAHASSQEQLTLEEIEHIAADFCCFPKRRQDVGGQYG